MAEKLKIIPLGGLNEIGKNMTVLEYGKDIIIIDCGLGFPEDDMYGVDLVIADVSYLVKNQQKIRKSSLWKVLRLKKCLAIQIWILRRDLRSSRDS